MTERAVRKNPEEAAELFVRGVGAAKGGQKRVAASLLARAVQLDPQHEQAWLWLSGVIDDPTEVAFCLRSVLSINPQSERARQGLVWLEQRQLIATQPAPPVIVAPVEPAPAVDRRKWHERPSREGWWVGMRRNRRETSRAWQIVLVAAIVLLSFTLGLNLLLRETLAQAQAKSAPLAMTVLPGATPLPTVIPIFQPALAASGDASSLAYLSVLDAQRSHMRDAVARYRKQTSTLGNSAVLHANAARELRNQVSAAYSILAELNPPKPLQVAHASYLEGLDQERGAMDDMLEFYGSFSVKLANRAVLRLEDANQRFEQAQAMFTAIQQQANNSGVPAITAR